MIPDFTIIGAGIFGLTSAIELRNRGHSVKVISPGSIPHPLAASDDISKIVRMEYGRDTFYMEAVDQSIDIWHDWNLEFGTVVYHETGFVLLSSQSMEEPSQDYELSSFNQLISHGHTPERLDADEIAKRFPAFESGRYTDGFFHARAGYAESGRVVSLLKDKAVELGIEIAEGIEISGLISEDAQVTHLVTSNAIHIPIGHCIIAAGAATLNILPEMRDYLVSTGHPVFHVKPEFEADFTGEKFPVFAADISNSGWYGFPLHQKAGVVKIANHGIGIHVDPQKDSRILRQGDIDKFRLFISASIPTLATAPIVYTRRCLYSDTRDGHFWIDKHSDFNNLTIAAGGSGHGFKMAPLLGKWICAAAEGRRDDVPERFRWRGFESVVSNEEEARAGF
ncbi:MAG: sarcosine oxidase [Bacteroidetes bacterium]|nr:MAG: sarcosine oxidase [Bacteroidota bacterium]